MTPSITMQPEGQGITIDKQLIDGLMRDWNDTWEVEAKIDAQVAGAPEALPHAAGRVAERVGDERHAVAPEPGPQAVPVSQQVPLGSAS